MQYGISADRVVSVPVAHDEYLFAKMVFVMSKFGQVTVNSDFRNVQYLTF